MPMIGQAYSSTYPGIENYRSGQVSCYGGEHDLPLTCLAEAYSFPLIQFVSFVQDMLSESWISNGGQFYTKHEAIAITTDLGGEGRLNDLVPTPMSKASFVLWNQDFIAFIEEAMADGEMEPCENQVRISKASAAAKPVDKLCEALLANDLSDYINSISYPYDLCHSADDEVVVSQ